MTIHDLILAIGDFPAWYIAIGIPIAYTAAWLMGAFLQ